MLEGKQKRAKQISPQAPFSFVQFSLQRFQRFRTVLYPFALRGQSIRFGLLRVKQNGNNVKGKQDKILFEGLGE